eukprot:g42007.t1
MQSLTVRNFAKTLSHHLAQVQESLQGAGSKEQRIVEKEGSQGTALQGSPARPSTWKCWQYDLKEEERQQANSCSEFQRRARVQEEKNETSHADQPASEVQEHEAEFWPFSQEAQDLQQSSVRSGAISKSKENLEGKIWARDDDDYGHHSKIKKGSYCVLYHRRDGTHSAQQDPLAPEHPMSLCKILKLTNLNVQVEWLIEARDPSKREPAPMLQGQYTQYSKIYSKHAWEARAKKAQQLSTQQRKGEEKASTKKLADDVARQPINKRNQPVRKQPQRAAHDRKSQVAAGDKRGRAVITPQKEIPNKPEKRKSDCQRRRAIKIRLERWTLKRAGGGGGGILADLTLRKMPLRSPLTAETKTQTLSPVLGTRMTVDLGTTAPRKTLKERQRQSLPGVVARLAIQRQRKVFSAKKHAKKNS